MSALRHEASVSDLAPLHRSNLRTLHRHDGDRLSAERNELDFVSRFARVHVHYRADIAGSELTV